MAAAFPTGARVARSGSSDVTIRVADIGTTTDGTIIATAIGIAITTMVGAIAKPMNLNVGAGLAQRPSLTGRSIGL